MAMTLKSGDPSQAPLEGVVDAPEIYIDGYQGALRQGSTVKFNLYTVLLDTASDGVRLRCPAVLSMSLPTLISMHAAIGELLEQFEKEGILTRHAGDAS